MKNSSQLLQFTEACMRLATQRVPPYSSKFSKHTFTQPQLVVLYCLKIKLGVTYRELIDWLEEMPRLRESLGLKQLPHFTTLQKAFQRLSTAIWRVLQQLSAALLPGDGVAAVDASGWDRSHASRSYTQRVKLQLRSLKTTLLVDTRAQTVLDLHVTTTRKHDTQIAPRLTERNLKRFEVLAADKGYDDQTYRGWLRSWGKRPLIKHREFAPADIAANARMDEKLYHRRSLVETVISVLKRTYGATVSSRVWWRQFRELVAMCLVYNVERAVKLGVTLLDWLWFHLLYFFQQRISTEPVIAIVDSDEMHKPFGKGTRISRLQELLKSYKHLRAFPVRDNLEDLIQNCLPSQKRREFNDRIHARLKLAAAQWAIKQDLDVDTLKNKLVDLEGYLRCQQQKEI